MPVGRLHRVDAMTTHVGGVYICILEHNTNAPVTEPGVGSDWETYWRLVGGEHAVSHEAGGTDVLLLNRLGLPDGAVNFNGNEATGLRVENRTSDPGSPEVGRLWLRTDL